MAGALVDRMTKATLWVAALVLGSYFVWAILDCELDATCQLRCAPTGVSMGRGNGSCVYQRTKPTPALQLPNSN